LTSGSVEACLARHSRKIAISKVYVQQDPRLEVPHEFLDQYRDLVRTHVVGVNSRLICNIDETSELSGKNGRASAGLSCGPSGTPRFTLVLLSGLSTKRYWSALTQPVKCSVH
jgi:hypothetical protein